MNLTSLGKQASKSIFSGMNYNSGIIPVPLTNISNFLFESLKEKINFYSYF